MPKASITGTANRNIIVVPCIVKIWLYRSGERNEFSGRDELNPHQHGEDAGQGEKPERRHDLAPADRLVIDVRQPADEPARIAPRALEVECARDLAAMRRLQVRGSHLQGLQVGEAALEIGGREPVRRHAVARLEVLRVRNPPGEVAASVWQPSRRR